MLKKNCITIISIVLVITSLFIAFNTKKSFVNNTNYNENEMNDFSVQIDTKDYKWYRKDIEQLESLISNSSIVVKVKLLYDRKIESKTILSQVKIIDIYKGNENLINSEIGVYEAAFPEKRSDVLTSYNGCLPMKDNNEYLLFLKSPIPYDAYNDKDKNYMLVSDKYGKYALNNVDELDYLIYSNELKYENVKAFNIILSDENDIKNYMNIKKEIFSKLVVNIK